MAPQIRCEVPAGAARVLTQAACSFRALRVSRTRSTQEGLAILLRGAIAEGTGKGPLAQWQSTRLKTAVSAVRFRPSPPPRRRVRHSVRPAELRRTPDQRFEVADPESSPWISAARYRRCPPSVRIDDSLPAFAHLVTVFGSTRNSAATSAGVRSFSTSCWFFKPNLPLDACVTNASIWNLCRGWTKYT